MGALLYLPVAWTDDDPRRAAARVPAAVRYQEKWRLALTLWRRARAAQLTITAVVADADYGDHPIVREAFHGTGVPYALASHRR